MDTELFFQNNFESRQNLACVSIILPYVNEPELYTDDPRLNNF